MGTRGAPSNYGGFETCVEEIGQRLVQKGQVSAYKYSGIYQPMDTLQDKKNLEDLWKSGKPYWKVWE